MSTGTDSVGGEPATNPEAKLAELGYPLRLPPTGARRPYEPLVQVGNIVYGSGNTSMDRHAGVVFAGRVGSRKMADGRAGPSAENSAGPSAEPSADSNTDIDLETARERARIATINALAGLKAHLGELSRIRRFVRLTGYVNSNDDFTQQADVINAASELLLAAFGDKGRHARSALGVAQLPGGASVEVEVIVEVEA